MHILCIYAYTHILSCVHMYSYAYVQKWHPCSCHQCHTFRGCTRTPNLKMPASSALVDAIVILIIAIKSHSEEHASNQPRGLVILILSRLFVRLCRPIEECPMKWGGKGRTWASYGLFFVALLEICSFGRNFKTFSPTDQPIFSPITMSSKACG